MNQITPNPEQFLIAERLIETKGRGRSAKKRGPVVKFVRRYLWLLLMVVLPTVISGVYLFGFAADQYMSEASFVIKSPQEKRSGSSLAAMMETAGGMKGDEQSNAVLEFILSRDALTALQKRIDISAIYNNSNADLLSRFSRPFQEDSFEALYDYYLGKVDAYITPSTGLSHLEVKAFTPGDAQKVATEILNLSEDLVNRLNQRSHDRAIEEASRRVDEAEDRMRKAQQALGNFRNSQTLVDPTKQSSGALELIGRLDGELSATQAQLDQMRKATPNNPAIKVIQDRVTALTKEISNQTAKLVGNDTAMASKIGDYENLLLEKELSAKLLEVASASLENARADADRQQFYLERVVEPNRPDFARYPMRIKLLLTIFGASLFIFFMAWMLTAGIREHAPKD